MRTTELPDGTKPVDHFRAIFAVRPAARLEVPEEPGVHATARITRVT